MKKIALTERRDFIKKATAICDAYPFIKNQRPDSDEKECGPRYEMRTTAGIVSVSFTTSPLGPSAFVNYGGYFHEAVAQKFVSRRWKDNCHGDAAACLEHLSSRLEMWADAMNARRAVVFSPEKIAMASTPELYQYKGDVKKDGTGEFVGEVIATREWVLAGPLGGQNVGILYQTTTEDRKAHAARIAQYTKPADHFDDSYKYFYGAEAWKGADFKKNRASILKMAQTGRKTI